MNLTRTLCCVVVAVSCAACGPDKQSPQPLAANSERWNEVFRVGKGFNPQPGELLAQMIQGRPPGRALDVGMGQGRNAIFLAQQGWHVTGIDISEAGIRQAKAAASAQQLELEAIVADADTWDYGVARWDLVALIYAPRNFDKVKASVKPGGLVVVEYFHKDAAPAIGTDPSELAESFKEGFTVLRNEVVEQPSDWGKKPRRPPEARAVRGAETLAPV